MNSISSSAVTNFTASSILSNANSAKVAEQNQNATAELQTQDTLVKSEKEESSIKTFFKKKVGNPFKKMTDNEKSSAIKGAVIGGTVGGIAGGITAYNMSLNKIKATNEIQSVTLDWQEPNMIKENLGQIPSDYYSWSPGPRPSGLENVTVQNPVIENGKPVMHDVTKTYSDYGKPVVTWQSHDIKHKTLEGYDEVITESTHTESQYIGTDAEGNKHYQDYEVVDGYWHTFHPDFGVEKLGTYQTPNVKFETGVNVGLNTTLGVLAGAGIGALAGGIAGAAIQHAIDKNKPEMPNPPENSTPKPPSGDSSPIFDDEPIVYNPTPSTPGHIHHPSHGHIHHPAPPPPPPPPPPYHHGGHIHHPAPPPIMPPHHGGSVVIHHPAPGGIGGPKPPMGGHHPGPGGPMPPMGGHHPGPGGPMPPMGGPRPPHH